MNFSKKGTQRFLGLFNSEDQPPSQQPPRWRRNIQSPAIGLSSIADTSNMPGLSNVIHSVTQASATAVAGSGIGGGKECSGSIPTVGEDDHETVRGDSGTNRPECRGFLEGIGANVSNRLDLSTESLGFESFIERSNSGDLMAELLFPSITTEGTVSRKATARARRSEKAKPKDFPPLLSSLNENGRQRFNLRKETIDGRLVITQVRNDRPEIVRIRGQDGGLKLELTSYAEEEEEEEEEDAYSCNDDEKEERDYVDESGGGVSGGGGKVVAMEENGLRCGGDLVR